MTTIQSRIVETSGQFQIATPSGNIVRTTSGEVFSTADRALADEALAYLNAPLPAGKFYRAGSHQMKSMFGKI